MLECVNRRVICKIRGVILLLCLMLEKPQPKALGLVTGTDFHWSWKGSRGEMTPDQDPRKGVVGGTAMARKEDWGHWSTAFKNVKDQGRTISKATARSQFRWFPLSPWHIWWMHLRASLSTPHICPVVTMAHTHLRGSKKSLMHYLCIQTSVLLIPFQEKGLARKADIICKTLITISSCSCLILDLLLLFFLTDIYYINLFHHITFMLAYHKPSFLL